MFHVVSAMAGFERALIQERVRAGLRNARAKGKRLGRPRVFVSAAKIADLRKQGRSWAQIVGRLGSARARHSERCPACPKTWFSRFFYDPGSGLTCIFIAVVRVKFLHDLCVTGSAASELVPAVLANPMNRSCRISNFLFNSAMPKVSHTFFTLPKS